MCEWIMVYACQYVIFADNYEHLKKKQLCLKVNIDGSLLTLKSLSLVFHIHGWNPQLPLPPPPLLPPPPPPHNYHALQ